MRKYGRWMAVLYDKEEEKTRCINENASQLKSLTEKVFALGS